MMPSIRKIGSIGRTYRHLNRYSQILAILFKYGFGDMVERLRIDQYIEAGFQMISKTRRVEKMTRMERIRMVFQELGPTFVKMGQILSTRPDLVPVELVHELAVLQDKVPARPFTEIETTLEIELGLPHGEVFESFDERPIASASIGQVHKARLKTGDDVAVKVQRSGIRRTIEVDLEIMHHLATLMERHVEGMDLYSPVKIVEEFARVLEKELDYLVEGSNMERFARRFENDPTVYIPQVFKEMTTEKVLIMEFVTGIKITDREALEKAGLDRKAIMSRGTNFLLRQVFDHGFFHADPHPGNIFVLPDNVVCLLDFGMVGTVDRTTREDFVDLLDSVVRQDERKVCQTLMKIADFHEDQNLRLLEREVSEFMGMHLYKPLQEVEVRKVLQDLLNVAGRHHIKIPPDVFLMMKAMGTVEGVARIVDPEFDMVAQATPFVERIKIARFHPQRISDDLFRLLSETIGFMHRFPRDAAEIAHMARLGKLAIRVDHRGIENILNTTERTSNKISFSLIIAALIIGSALIVISKTPPLFYGISIIGIILFFAAAIMGIWLLVAILRKGGL